MISSVFETMDADGDGLLSMNDMKAYFRGIGKNSSDTFVRRWINARDIDQNGTVSLIEFVASYSLQLDPANAKHSNGSKGSGIPQGSVAVAFGAVCLGKLPLNTYISHFYALSILPL